MINSGPAAPATSATPAALASPSLGWEAACACVAVTPPQLICISIGISLYSSSSCVTLIARPVSRLRTHDLLLLLPPPPPPPPLLLLLPPLLPR